ncbi:MAG: hypothetical protein Q4D55_11525 [Eubacteriales bacterium]|nr:hypothetical protein [Eubacteriales bacterium]
MILLAVLFLHGIVAQRAEASEAGTSRYMVQVDKGYLALRSEKAYDSSNEIAQLENGERVWLLGEADQAEEYWYVYSDKAENAGYVNRNFLLFERSFECTTAEVKVDSGYLALRSAKAYDYKNELGELYTGDVVTVLNVSDPEYWFVYSEDLGKAGYVNQDYLVGYELGAVPDGGYDIAEGLNVHSSEGNVIFESDHFTIYAPGSVEWDYTVLDNTAIKFYYAPAQRAGYGGWFVTIKAYDWGDNSYEDIPDYKIAAKSFDKKYVAIFPTDVQYDNHDAGQVEEYERLLRWADHLDVNDDGNPMTVWDGMN